MSGQVLLYVGAALTALWGISHLIPTGKVVASFGDITADNRRIITMEWITEGVALVLIGVLVAVVTAIGEENDTAVAVYLISAAGLLSLAGVSLATGFRVSFLPFRLCPFIFSGSAALILVGALI